MSTAADPAVVLRYVGALLGEARRSAAVNGFGWPPALEAARLLAIGAHTGSEVVPGTVLAVNYDEAARRLGVSRSTVRRRCYRGELPRVWIGQSPRIRVADLEHYLAEQSAGTRRTG